tara:strand:+ start:630 stop:1043 length:414 start_codon:yes stop_codon:yes gene_type:complete
MTITVIGIGAAPGDDTGDGLRTAFNKVNNNFSDANNAASKLVGTAAGQIPTADESWHFSNMDPTNASGLNAPRLLQNLIGFTLSDGQVGVAGSSLRFAKANGSGVVTAGTEFPSGTWNVVTGTNILNTEFGYFVRVA